MALKCPACVKGNYEKISSYKHLMPEDKQYLGDMELIYCKNCELIFSYPFPTDEMLNYYYKNIYRKPGRPHYIESAEDTQPTIWHKSQFWYISQFIDLFDVKNILEFGSGYGFLLREIKKQMPRINLYTVDPDDTSMSYLKNFGINFKNQTNELVNNEKYDLIISSHSLEHMTDPKSFFAQVKDNLTADGKMFLEVPNCPISFVAHEKLPYHGPHVLFFIEKSLEKLINDSGFKVEHMITTGVDLVTEINLMKKSYDQFNSLEKRKTELIKSSLKQILPKSVKSKLRALRNALTSNDIDDVPEFFKYGGDRWAIRCMLKPI